MTIKHRRLNEWNINDWNSLDKIAMFAIFVIAVASAWSWATY